jgi:FkbM family methyltransferase
LNFSVDTENDFYGLNFWQGFANLQYEPDTVALLYSLTGPGVHFMDLGAANGAMTLLAMLNGSSVTSYEPNPVMFQVLTANTKLNLGTVNLKNCAVSDSASQIEYSIHSDTKILSDIVFGAPQDIATKVRVLSLSEEIKSLNLDPHTKLIIKMDIEGAEWKILRNSETLQTLSKNHATLLLAIHPGFYRPMGKGVWLKFVRLNIFRILNFCDSWKLYRNLTRTSRIKRTNLNIVPTALRFSMLVMSGCHEYLIEFK